MERSTLSFLAADQVFARAPLCLTPLELSLLLGKFSVMNQAVDLGPLVELLGFAHDLDVPLRLTPVRGANHVLCRHLIQVGFVAPPKCARKGTSRQVGRRLDELAPQLSDATPPR